MTKRKVKLDQWDKISHRIVLLEIIQVLDSEYFVLGRSDKHFPVVVPSRLYMISFFPGITDEIEI